MTSDEDRALHARLLARDATASSDFLVAHLRPLIDQLGRGFPNVESSDLVTAPARAASTPHPFDPL